MHIWPYASIKVSKTQKTLLDVFFIFRIYYDLKQIWFAEHSKIVVPKALPEDKFVPRAGRWNLKHICNALLKDMDASDYVFDQKIIDPYTEKEKVVLNMSEEGGIMFLEEGREDKYEELRMTIKSSWEQMQKMDCNNEEVVPKMQEMLNKIYFKAYPDILPDTTHKEFDDSVQLDDDAEVDVPMSYQEAPEDDSNSVQVKNDKRVEFVFGDDVENIDVVDILIGLQETPRFETSATTINPEPTPIVTETTSSAPIAPKAKVVDESQEENHTAPETTSSASPKPATKLSDTKPHLVFKRNFKKRKASELNVQKDDILAENKKAKDEYVAARSAEIIQKLEEEGFFKGINSMDGNGKTSLEKVTRVGQENRKASRGKKDGESKPLTAKIDDFALATSRNRNNIQVEASSVVTRNGFF
ncbi:hypothetical protein MKW98_014319 [Papaver atlanticum]|uniref:Uncharacterized protein n=1 Tax=Papaver atlanticum TaxID=357466 RepID=A0AAD4SYF3_9MAGN|nr:hypothetical protein MKW98_014319 [Papaver atlanticum]